MRATVNIPFAIEGGTDDRGFYYAEKVEGVSGYFGSATKAKATLRARIADKVSESLVQVESRSRAIGCKDGTVLIVRYRFGSWGYNIVGPGREHGYSGFIMGSSDPKAEEGTLQRAREHAENFGGIAFDLAF